MKSLDKIIGISIVMATVILNLWLYRMEPAASVDPNDNSFQFALVDRTNTVWDYAWKQCQNSKLKAQNDTLPIIGPLKDFALCTLNFALLFDHWVPNWAQGYNLPYYYSHLPQIAIVASWRTFDWLIGFIHNLNIGLLDNLSASWRIGLFDYYHQVIYLLLCFFPLSVFFALRVIGLPWIISGIGAFSASQLSTDGLYGLDPSSFLWRGFGLSSQLFAMIWLPLAIAYSFKLFSQFNHRQDVIVYLQKLLTFLSRSVTKFSQIAFRAQHQESDYKQTKNREISVENHKDLRAAEQENFRHAKQTNFILAVFFLVLTTAGHLGIGIMAILGLIPLAFGSLVLPLVQNIMDKSVQKIKDQFTQEFLIRSILLMLLVGSVVLILSYWILPVLLHDLYHNTSVWDPVWKFDSYGARDVLTKLLAGDLFDFGRFPLLTLLTLIGFLSAMSEKIFESRSSSLAQKNSTNKNNQQNNSAIKNKEALASSDPRIFSCEYQRSSYAAFPFLFLFYLALYFGRTTWGPLIDLIPGMSDFHISRFIVGVHIAGIFLVPLGIWWIVSWVMGQASGIVKRLPLPSRLDRNDTFPETIFRLFVYLFIGVFIYWLITPQTIEYAQHNDRLILQANENYSKISDDTEELLKTLNSLLARSSLGEGGGRVYSGRGGNWGKNFRVAETPMYMHISTYGIPTVLWLPETWSPNSDTEQFFSEDRIEDYILYNLRYVVTPARNESPCTSCESGRPFDKEPLSFWKPLKEGKTWKLYEVLHSKVTQLNNSTTQQLNNSTTQAFGYITSGYDVARVVSDKFSFVNLIRLWINSDNPKLGLFPRIELKKNISQSHISSPQSQVLNLPFFTMSDEATYQTPDGKTHSLFNEPPSYSVNPTTIEKGVDTEKYGQIKILSQSSDTDMVFKASVEVSDKCTTCLVILRQTYHPSWVVLVDGKRVESFSVFPFYTAAKVSPGTHDIAFSYEPSFLKKTLFILFLGGMIVLIARLIAKLIALPIARHITRLNT